MVLVKGRQVDNSRGRMPSRKKVEKSCMFPQEANTCKNMCKIFLLWKLSAFINRGMVYSFSRVPGAQYHRHLLHHSPEGWKSEIKVWAELVSSEASFPGLWMASSLCIFTSLRGHMKKEHCAD